MQFPYRSFLDLMYTKWLVSLHDPGYGDILPAVVAFRRVIKEYPPARCRRRPAADLPLLIEFCESLDPEDPSSPH